MSWEQLTNHPPSPIQELEDALFREKGIRVLVKRDDLLCLPVEPGDRAFCGNKWRKMKYNVWEAKNKGAQTLVTFGGAFSNHVAAVAAAGRLFGFQTAAVLRGEPYFPLNPTLSFAERCGMQLAYLSREQYRHKEDQRLTFRSEAAQSLYILPEGGTNALAILGCAELAREILDEAQPDFCCVACGTGGTAAGLIAGFEGRVRTIGFPVLKGEFLFNQVLNLAGENGSPKASAWTLQTGYHFGGYAKWTPPLIDFIRYMEARFGLPLDPVYTGKLFFGVWDLMAKDYFSRGATICLVHTGGLQGVAGFKQRFPLAGL
ncbi:MAG: 1-aminocyclopropane-1-carboxylate deaminase/D-cysteine desulfhydrase [Haliscomenobacter sp.]|nr:1-aminocyclopropane-1-carboxylate deaminase/D-cysteine desulfhydrase [Haliscomenobacter sp.]